jgi:hypothetical protein
LDLFLQINADVGDAIAENGEKGEVKEKETG